MSFIRKLDDNSVVGAERINDNKKVKLLDKRPIFLKFRKIFVRGSSLIYSVHHIENLARLMRECRKKCKNRFFRRFGPNNGLNGPSVFLFYHKYNIRIVFPSSFYC